MVEGFGGRARKSELPRRNVTFLRAVLIWRDSREMSIFCGFADAPLFLLRGQNASERVEKCATNDSERSGRLQGTLPCKSSFLHATQALPGGILVPATSDFPIYRKWNASCRYVAGGEERKRRKQDYNIEQDFID